MRSSCAVAFVCALIPGFARANTPEDVYGASGRTIAMGGAGTALPGDYAATHYNPANLSACGTDQVSVDIHRIVHRLSFTDEDVARTEPLVPEPARDQTRFVLGACLALPLGFSLGALAGFGTPGAIVLDQSVANETPQFTMYGEANQQLSFALGLAWQATPQLSIGAGFAALFETKLPLDANLPVLEPDPTDPSGYRPVSFSLGVSLGGNLAPRFGLLYAPSPRFRIGAAYRGPLFHDLDVDAYLTAKLIVEIPVPVHVDSLGWFSPRQLSVGASGEPAANLTIAADVTYYRWGELRTSDSSYPFLNIYSLDPEGASGALVFPRPIRSGWKNNLAVRAGGELRPGDGSLAVRAGAGYRTRAVNNPDNSSVNLLDAPTLNVAAGIAWQAGDARSTAPRRRWWRYDLPHVTFSAEAFVRVDHLFEQQVDHSSTAGDDVPEKHYRFGGDVLQIGGKLALGW
jgi:long-subunit fatty acid transport protein